MFWVLAFLCIAPFLFGILFLVAFSRAKLASVYFLAVIVYLFFGVAGLITSGWMAALIDSRGNSGFEARFTFCYTIVFVGALVWSLQRWSRRRRPITQGLQEDTNKKRPINPEDY
jgi:hypothetical protein